MKRTFVVAVMILIVLSVSIQAHTALVDNGNGTITQTRSDGSLLMWLQDANYAETSGYSGSGLMTWDDANNWIDTLNSNIYLGYSDWRLPDVLPVNGVNFNYNSSYDGSTDIGYNITSLNSEMSYLFYVELENTGYWDTNGNGPQPGWGLTNSDLFNNLQAWNYWTGEEYAPSPTQAWGFNFQYGGQADQFKNGPAYGYALAVRSVVPEPISSTLFIVGGATMGFRRFRKRFIK